MAGHYFQYGRDRWNSENSCGKDYGKDIRYVHFGSLYADDLIHEGKHLLMRLGLTAQDIADLTTRTRPYLKRSWKPLTASRGSPIHLLTGRVR